LRGSSFRGIFGADYSVSFSNGPLASLLFRSVVIDEKGKVVYTEQVAETAYEPNYDAAIAASLPAT
jgi:thiol peroxidase